MVNFKLKLSREKILIFLSFFLIFTLSFLASYFFLSKIIIKNEKKEVVKEEEIARTPTPYFQETKKEERRKNILLLGYGGAGHSGGYLSDLIILLSLDKEQKKAHFISIPRDIWINLPYDWENLKPAKINEAYAMGIDDIKYQNKRPEFRGKLGSGNMVKYAANQITGLSVDYFASVSFEELISIINKLGGIKVEVPVSFTDEYYPIKGLENETCGKTPEEMEALKQTYSGFELEKQYKCRYETISFEKGIVEMNGEITLKFVRSRHSPTYGGDFSRSKRQIAVLKGIKEKLISIDAFNKIDDISQDLINLVTTDLNLSTLKDLAIFMGNAEAYQIKEINLSTENVLSTSKGPQGQFILIPKSGFNNWQETQKFIKKEMEEN